MTSYVLVIIKRRNERTLHLWDEDEVTFVEDFCQCAQIRGRQTGRRTNTELGRSDKTFYE